MGILSDFIEIAILVVCSLGNVRRCGFSQSSADGLWGWDRGVLKKCKLHRSYGVGQQGW